MDEKNKEKGLKNTTIVLMLSVALFFDTLNALFNVMFIYWIVTIVWAMTFFVWFLMHGILFWKPKRLLAMGGGLILELIPIISILPAMTAAVAIVAFDAKLKKILSKAPGGQIVGNVIKGKFGTSEFKSSSRKLDVDKAA